MDDGDRGQAAADMHLQAALADRRNRQPLGAAMRVCIDCEEPIPEVRRQAAPGCTRCIACQQKAERNA